MYRMLRNVLSLGILHPDGDPAVAKPGQGPGAHGDASWSIWASRASKGLVLASVLIFIVGVGLRSEVKMLGIPLAIIGAILGLASIKPGRSQRSGFEGMVANVVVLILMQIAAPNFMRANDPPLPDTDVRSGMDRLQRGLKSYAEEHHGKFPAGVRNTSFWTRHILRAHETLFSFEKREIESQAIADIAGMEPDVRLNVPAGTSLATIALNHAPIGRPGSIRYFVDHKTHLKYAIFGYGKNGNPVRNLKRQSISSFFGSKSVVVDTGIYILHN